MSIAQYNSTHGEIEIREDIMNESQLELSVMELFGQEGYEYINGESLLRQTSDVLLRDDLKAYLLSRYSVDSMNI